MFAYTSIFKVVVWL